MEEVRRSGRATKTVFKQEEELGKYTNKWTQEEQQIILNCLKIYGHKAIDKISEQLPNKSKESIRNFLLLAHNQANKTNEVVSGIKYWLDRSKSEMKKTDTIQSNYLYMPAQVIKYLSIDGLLENHPKPENCGEVDFAAAYRLIYQALMGYPLQPVNQATADFITDTFNEILANKNPSLINELSEIVKKKIKVNLDSSKGFDKSRISNGKADTEFPFNNEKPVIVYKRKKPVPFSKPDSLNKVNPTPLQVVFKEKGPGESGNSKFYSVAIRGKSDVSPIVVPVPVKMTKSNLEIAASSLWENTGFNPLELTQENIKKHLADQI